VVGVRGHRDILRARRIGRIPQVATYRDPGRMPGGHFGEKFLERRKVTVRKGVLKRPLGRRPTMRKACQSDLSDAERGCLEPHFLAPEANERPRHHSLRESLTPSSTC
jgi:hypothetical protein